MDIKICDFVLVHNVVGESRFTKEQKQNDLLAEYL